MTNLFLAIALLGTDHLLFMWREAGLSNFQGLGLGFIAGGFRGGPGGATPPAPFCAGFSFGKRVSDGTSSLRAGRVVLSPQWLRPLVAS